jgi:hypothetical protein
MQISGFKDWAGWTDEHGWRNFFCLLDRAFGKGLTLLTLLWPKPFFSSGFGFRFSILPPISLFRDFYLLLYMMLWRFVLRPSLTRLRDARGGATCE